MLNSSPRRERERHMSRFKKYGISASIRCAYATGENQEDKFHAEKKDRRAKHRKFLFVENEVLKYVKRLCSDGCAVSHELIQNHTRATARNHGIPACD